MANNRCPDCNKFVATEIEQEPEVEVTSVEDTGEGKAVINLTFKLTKVCADCGTQLSEKEVEAEVTVDTTGFEGVI